MAAGQNALYNNTEGEYNTGVGYNALTANTTGDYNTACGTGALDANTTASNCSAFGGVALSANTTGVDNNAFGVNALAVNTTGYRNQAFGVGALIACTVGFENNAFGYYALGALTEGDYNCAVGHGNLDACTTGNGNVFMGYHAGGAITTGGENTGFGHKAGYSVTTGDHNVFLGHKAGQGQVTTGSDELYIARSSGAKGTASCWVYGDGSGNCIQGSNQTAWDTTSDRRLKKNIVNSSRGLAEIDQLRVTNFEYRKEDEIDMSEFPLADGPHQVCLNDESKEGVVQTGVIAQEVEAVLPECIRVSNKGAKTVQTDPIMWALVNAVKELSTKNDELAAEIASLKSQINN